MEICRPIKFVLTIESFCNINEIYRSTCAGDRWCGIGPSFASAIGAGAFALFTRNPSRWKSEPLTAREIDDFRRNCAEGGFTPDRILPHDSYLINLGAKDPKNFLCREWRFWTKCSVASSWA